MSSHPFRFTAGLAALPLLVLPGAAARAELVPYTLDPEHSFVHFEVQHFGTSTTRGRFGPVRGVVMLDRHAGRGEVSLRIPIASVDTGVPQRDLLASAEHPDAFFVATRFRFEGERLAEVRGEFTLRGIGQPLSLHATHFACRPAGGGEVCGGDFEAELLRSDFGATFGLPLVGDRVRLKVQVEGRR